VVWNKGLSGNPDSPNYDPRLAWNVGENNPAKRPEVRTKLSKYMKENNPMDNPEYRKNVSTGLKKLYASDGYVNKNIGTHPSEQTIQNMSKGQRRRMKNNPEEWARTCRKAGLAVHKKHPNQAREMGLATQRKHPNQSREVAKRTNREWRERDIEDYYVKKREYCKIMLEKRMKIKKENPKLYKEMYKNAGVNSFQSILDNSPFYWKGVPFLSNLEREAAKLILMEPKKGINCHIKIGRKTIDFYPQQYDLQFQGKLVEFHPYERHTTQDEYFKARKKIVDNSKYNGTELIVITNLNDIKEEK